MKLIYHKPSYLRYAARKARRILKRNRRKKTELRTYNIKQSLRLHRNRLQRLPPVSIRIPDKFTISDNTTETLGFFQTLHDSIKEHRRVYLDMSDCRILGIDAVLYFFSLCDHMKLKGIRCSIKGNVPKNQKCLKLLMSTGFFQLVRSRMPQSAPDPNVLRIASGALINHNVAREVIDFSLKHLKQGFSAKSRAIYRILIEMMGNTREHAYIRQAETSKWHMLAIYEKETEAVRFAFLDGGQGVPTTIYKNHRERVMKLLDKIPMINTITGVRTFDACLLESALRGEFRSKTKQGYRGKGMPEIYGLAENRNIASLKLVSGKGFFDCSSGQATGLDTKFEGTLYTWVFL